MERFLGSGPMVSVEDDEDMRLVDEILGDDEDQSTNTEPPELPTDVPYTEYLERHKTLRREEGWCLRARQKRLRAAPGSRARTPLRWSSTWWKK